MFTLRPMSLTQSQLAKSLGIHRSVISKLLNDPKSIRSSKKTRAAVYKLVKKSGYLEKFYQTKHHRSDERKKVNMQAKVDVILNDGAKYASGSVKIINISKSGALLSELKVKCLPVKPFKFVIKPQNAVCFEGKPTRIEMNGEVQFGISIVSKNGAQENCPKV